MKFKVAGKVSSRSIRLSDCDPSSRTIVVDDVNEAPVGQKRNRKAGDAEERCFAVERCCQKSAGFREKTKTSGRIRFRFRHAFPYQEVRAFGFRAFEITDIAKQPPKSDGLSFFVPHNPYSQSRGEWASGLRPDRRLPIA